MTHYPRWRERLEGALIAGTAACGLALARDVLAYASGALDLAWICASVALGYVAADLVTGLIHWAGDRLGTPTTPWLGPAWIAPFREHHVDPQAMATRGFVELCGTSFIGVAPVWIAAWLALSDRPGDGALALRSFALSIGLFTGITNQVHGWAHRPAPGRVVAWLQGRGLILSPERHALHHTPPFAQHYCVTTGWLNPLLERVRLFERLEAALGLDPRSRTEHLASGSRAQDPA